MFRKFLFFNNNKHMKQKMATVPTLFVILNVISVGLCTLIFPPASTNGTEIGLVLIPGDSIDAHSYANFAQTLQKTLDSQTRAWIAIAQDTDMDLVFADLKSSGANMDQQTPFFFIGHSSGGSFLQDYLIPKLLPVKLAGLILEGSYIKRANNMVASCLVNILTIGAELDGLVRITRIAESYYFDSINKFQRVCHKKSA